MNLADMLCYADIDQLTRIARTYDCSCGSHSKNDLIQSILAAVQRREALECRMEEITGDDLRFLSSLLFENRGSYSLEELKARACGTEAEGTSNRSEPVAEAAPSVSPAKAATGTRSRKKKAAQPDPAVPEDAARQTIARFKRYGWLFNGFSQQTRNLYHVPEDVKRRLREALENRYRPRLDVRKEPPVYRDERGLLADDLTVFLRYARDNDVSLTSEGAMYRRQLGQVLELMSVEEEMPGKAGWRFGYGRRFRDYPDRFSLLYDFAFCEGWIREAPDRLVVTEAGLFAAEGREKTDPARLCRFWIRLYKGPVANLAALVHWIASLAGEWTTSASLFSVLQPIIRPYYYDRETDVLDRRVLKMMMHLGMLRRGETESGETVVRMTPQGVAVVQGTALPCEEALRFDNRGNSYA